LSSVDVAMLRAVQKIRHARTRVPAARRAPQDVNGGTPARGSAVRHFGH